MYRDKHEGGFLIRAVETLQALGARMNMLSNRERNGYAIKLECRRILQVYDLCGNPCLSTVSSQTATIVFPDTFRVKANISKEFNQFEDCLG